MPDSALRERNRCWLKRMCQDDETAFEALFMAYYENLCRFTSQYVSAHDVVEDLVQDIFLNVWERRRALDPEKSIRSYLYKAARNEALKYLNRQHVRRRYRDEQRRFGADAQNGPEERLRDRELETRVRRALLAIPERRRHIFILSRQHGLTYAEIAELLDISVKTVETQISRALRFLEHQFADVRAHSD